MSPRADGRAGGRWAILATMCVATAVTEFDETVMAVALPSIDAAFDAPLVTVQWSVTAYVLGFAALLVPAGRLTDVLGARRVFLAGAGVFAAGSAACAAAPEVGWLIAARVVQGIGAAIITPSSFAIVVATFPRDQRGRALGTWAAAVAVGAAIGPLGGGVLIDLFDWRAIFVMGVPIAVAATALVAVLVPESRGGTAPPPGVVSVAMLVAGLTLVLAGMGEGGVAHVGAAQLAMVAAGVALLVALVVHDARIRIPCSTSPCCASVATSRSTLSCSSPRSPGSRSSCSRASTSSRCATCPRWRRDSR